MSVVSINSHPKRSIPTSAIECLRDLAGLNVEDLGRPIGFRLKRRIGAAEVWFDYACFPKLSVNMSVHRQRWPANFREARLWMANEYPDVPELLRPSRP